MTIAVNDILRISARLLLDGTDDIINVYHLLTRANTTVDDTAAMVELAVLFNQLYTTINNRVSNRVTYTGLEGINVSKSELLPFTVFPVLTVGTDADDMIPEMNAACAFHRTLTPRVRASKFLPPTGETSNAGGALETVYKSLVQNFADLLTNLPAQPNIQVDYVAFNRLLSTSTGVVAGIVPSRFRTQRRRRKSVGS